VIDPFTISWFKKLHKFYADPYWDKFQISVKNIKSTPSNQTTSFSSSLSVVQSNMNDQNMNLSNNILISTQNQRFKGLLAILNDPNYQITRRKFLDDFNFLPNHTVNINSLISKIRDWIKLIENHIYSLPKKYLLDDRFKNIINYCSKSSDIELPGDYLITKSTNYNIKINRFFPWYEFVEKYNLFSRRISIRGHNGKTYPFLILNESTYYYESRMNENILQLMRFVNSFLIKQKETSRRNLHYYIPRIVSLSAEVRLIEDNYSSISLLSIFQQSKRKETNYILHPFECNDLPISSFFESINSSITQSLPDIFKKISDSIVSKEIIKKWALSTYNESSDYFNLRKTLTINLAMYNIAEYVFCLTRTNPDTFYIFQENGMCENIRSKFDFIDANNCAIEKSFCSSWDLNTKKNVPFRLTPNITEFINTFGVYGVQSAVMISMTRCILQPQYNFIWLLRAILKDSVINMINKQVITKLFIF
jgi:transformation/transcription domain-associated protein